VRWGEVDVGEPRAEPVLDALLEGVQPTSDRIYIIDAPPGTSCLPTAVVRASDFVVLVTEPTPLGLHDVRAALRMTRTIGVPAAAVLNRSDLGDGSVARFLGDEGLLTLAEIPFDEAVAHACAAGELPTAASPTFARAAQEVAEAATGRVWEGWPS
jgi:MinD superfamily P-loop ATPase